MTDKEKLERAVKLADAMYYAAQYLTTDASRLHMAMENYHQFIITEYNKQEPASEDLEQEIDRYFNTEGVLATAGAIRDTARHFAQWQKKQMLKDAIDATIDIVYAPTTWLPDIVYDRDKLKELCKDRFEQDDRIKVIIIKE